MRKTSPGRAIPAGFLVAVLCLGISKASATGNPHPSLEHMEPWLGTWVADSPTGEPTQFEFQAVLGGHFVESWQRNQGDGALQAHSMIGADPDDGSLIEYRFDAGGRLTVEPFDAGSGPEGRPAGANRVKSRSADRLAATLAVMRPFLGQWEVTTEWLDGGLLWAQMTNYAELGGRVICTEVLAAHGELGPYDRYRTFYYRDATGTLREITFSYKGLVVSESFSAERTVDGIRLESDYRPGSLASIGIRKVLEINSERTMHWTDYFRSEDEAAWDQVIDANWVRVGAPDPATTSMPVDDSLFAASGSDVPSVTVERLMEATPEQVWAAWTTEAGWKAAYAPDRPEVRANIELAPGGKYEWLFDGRLGCNGCQVLSYLPYRMLAVTWNAPVAQSQSRVKHTWVVIEIEPTDAGRSRVRTTQLGFGSGPHWDETKAYFRDAWAYVLAQMASNLAKRP